MITLYRITKNGGRELVGFYETQVDAGCAINDDARKFDDESHYEMGCDKNENQTNKAS